jgi:hypothetical protein
MKIEAAKILVFIISFFTYLQSFAQTIDLEKQNEKFENDIDIIVEELKFMYDTDQAIREYTLFKTYDKAVTDSIENLTQEKVQEYILSKNFKSDSLVKRINEKYILPIDELNIKRIIELTKIYGFPSKSRIEKKYKGNLDEEFNPYILIVHAPKKYWDELKVLIKKELDNKRLSRCEYGHILWHLNGRKNIQDMLDNGFKLVTNEDGQQTIKAVDCE